MTDLFQICLAFFVFGVLLFCSQSPGFFRSFLTDSLLYSFCNEPRLSMRSSLTSTYCNIYFIYYSMHFSPSFVIFIPFRVPLSLLVEELVDLKYFCFWQYKKSKNVDDTEFLKLKSIAKLRLPFLKVFLLDCKWKVQGNVYHSLLSF